MAIVAHADDEVFGAGGTLANYGANSNVLCLTGNQPREKEFYQAIYNLGIQGKIIEASDFSIKVSKELIEVIVEEIQHYRPEIVLTHTAVDYHRDHRTTHHVVNEAIEWAGHVTQYGTDAWRVQGLFEMEINSLLSNPTIFIDISAVMDKKQAAVACYTTQHAKTFATPNYYDRFTYHKAKLRGLQAGVEFAEAFRQINLTWAGPFYPEKIQPYFRF